MTREAARLRELLAISRAITSTTDYQETLDLVVQKACAFSNADACLLLLAAPGAPASIAAAFGLAPDGLHKLRIVLDERLTSTLRERLALGPEGEITAVPMILGGEVRGSLVVIRRRRALEEESGRENERLLSVLADQASVTLGNMAHLRELEAAVAAAQVLRTLADEIPSMIAYWDSSLRCRFANRAYEQWFGVSPESLMGKHISELLGPLYQQNLPYIERALRGELQQFEREIPNPAGGPPRYSFANYIPDTAAGVVRGFFVLVTDVSAIKQAEAALRESEERFRLTIEEAPIGMALVAPDGRFVRVNRALCEIVGYTADELTGLAFQAITPPEDLDAGLALAEQLARGELSRCELGKRYIRKDGSIVDVILHGSVLRGPDGAPRHFIAQIQDVTERKRLADQLRLAEARASGILSISADAIISIDEHQRITMFNDGAERIFGYSRVEAIGAPLDLLIPEGFRATHGQHVDRFAAGQEVSRRMGPRRAAVFGLRKSGQEFPADAAISRLEIDGKRILTVAVRDVTAERQAHEELRQTQERFELALDGADLASWDWNIATGEVIFNRRWAEMRGLRPEEVVPHVDSWISGVHPDDWTRVQKALSDYFEGRSPEYETEHRVLTKSGQWLWVLDRGKVFARDQDGRPTRMTGTELDITERKRIETEQRFLAEVGPILARTLEYEETLSQIAELAVRDIADLCIVEVVEDDEAVRRLKVASRDPAKAWLCELLTRLPLDRSRPHLMRSVMETRQPVLMQCPSDQMIASLAQSEEHRRALQTAEIRSMLAVPLVAHAKLLGAIAFVSSTASRIYGPADVQLAEELAQRAALSIENARLYRAARRATQTRDEVLGVVAHDLRSPLSSIFMQASLLMRRPERGPEKVAGMIKDAVVRMNRLIEDILDVTRMEAGRLSVEAARVPTREVVSDSVDTQKPLAASASLELRLDVASNLPEVWADRDRLLQVFENLIGNAVKFTEPGGSITVGAAPRDGQVMFWVTDTGSGIDAADLPHLFDRFWQAKKAERRGAGLGLPIVKGLIEAHGGRIWVESTRGQGSTFFFTIPAALRAASPRHPVSSGLP